MKYKNKFKQIFLTKEDKKIEDLKKYGFEILIMDKEIKYLLEEIKDTNATKKEQE